MSSPHLEEQLNRYLSFLSQDQDNLKLLAEISSMYFELGDYEAAQNYLNKASALDRIACLGRQGLLYLNQDQFSLAQTCFIEALQHDDTPSLRYHLGLTYFLNQDTEGALSILLPLVEHEFHLESSLVITRIYHGQNQLEHALQNAQEIISNHADNAEAWGLLALIYFDLNDESKALDACTKALAIDSSNFDARVIDVMLRIANQQITLDEVQQLIDTNPQDCRLWFALGSVCMTQGAFVAAEQHFRRALNLYPDFYDCHIALGWCLLMVDQLQNANSHYRAAATLVPEISDSWAGQAIVAALNEHFEQADQFILQAKELNKQCFLTQIAESIYVNYHNPLQAKDYLAKALKNTQLPISQKIAFIMEDLGNSNVLH